MVPEQAFSFRIVSADLNAHKQGRFPHAYRTILNPKPLADLQRQTRLVHRISSKCHEKAICFNEVAQIFAHFLAPPTVFPAVKRMPGCIGKN